MNPRHVLCAGREEDDEKKSTTKEELKRVDIDWDLDGEYSLVVIYVAD